MAFAEQLVPVGFSLAAVLCWGTSDFTGGYASKRSDAFIITLLSHAGGFVLMLSLALLTHASLSFIFEPKLGAAGGCAGRDGVSYLLSHPR